MWGMTLVYLVYFGVLNGVSTVGYFQAGFFERLRRMDIKRLKLFLPHLANSR